MDETEQQKKNGIGLLPLAALVVGSAIGGGIFGIMSDISGAAAGPAIFSWLFVGAAMMMLSLSINNINKKRPDLEGGIFSYAEEGFGRFSGFISGWGYWLTCWLGNVAFATLLMSALGYFFPIFSGGQNVASVIFSTILLWGYALLVNQGVENASFVNAIVTICKLVPIFLFIVVAALSFSLQQFIDNFSSTIILDINGQSVAFSHQVLSCIMVMLWVFVGIEGASVVGSRAKKKSDVGKATILGLIGLLIVYALVSLLPYGSLSMNELQTIQTQPAMGYVFEKMVGKWGAVVINGGLIISLVGVWLSWTILPVETLANMAKDGLVPSYWSKLNKKGAPTRAIILTTVCTNIFLLSLLFTDKAYNFAYTLGTAAIFFTWLFLGLYQMKLSYQRKEWGQFLVGLLASAFQVWAMIFVAFSEVMLILVLFLPGIFFYQRARKETIQTSTARSHGILDRYLLIGISLLGVLALVLFTTGVLSI
ncbi:MAG: basic amino acid/polyamine antiporter [Enterococcus sp.]